MNTSVGGRCLGHRSFRLGSGRRRRAQHDPARRILRQRLWRFARRAFVFAPLRRYGRHRKPDAIGSAGKALAPNLATGKFQSVSNLAVETLNLGFSIQYSTYYLTNRFDGGPPKEEPLKQLVPLVEFSFDSPRGQNTAATMNPGFACVAVTWQPAAELIVPLNREGGSGTGFRPLLLVFLDDLLPSLFGKPPLTDQPDRSLIARH
jgi:hypothetical protein